MTTYVDLPLPGMPEPERVEPPAIEELAPIIAEGEVSLKQSFKLDIRRAIITHLDWFRETLSEYRVHPSDGSYFEGKLNAFVCALLDDSIEFLPLGSAGLVFDGFCDPEYDWKMTGDEQEKIKEWLLETGQWSVDGEVARELEAGRLQSLKPIRRVGVTTLPDIGTVEA